uniref:Beta-defensin-like domain-containing protein n=1 Tax=Terrapene triunguis TaxID=2587831 RepID=A0A674J7M7_9SAUR
SSLACRLFVCSNPGASGVADVGPPPADTLACKAQGGFCRLLSCPPVFSVSGTCHGGQLQCCTR